MVTHVKDEPLCWWVVLPSSDSYLVRAVRFRGRRIVFAAKKATKETREASAVIAACIIVSLEDDTTQDSQEEQHNFNLFVKKDRKTPELSTQCRV